MTTATLLSGAACVVGIAMVAGVLLRPCLWRGHVWMVRVKPTRMYLECLVCPAETPGWSFPPSIRRPA